MKKEKKPVKMKLIAIICAAVVIVGVGLYFLLSPGYYRDLSKVTMVAPDWAEETVILYEKDFYRHSLGEREETEEFIILKFEPNGGTVGKTYYSHAYYFRKDNGKLNHFSYSTDGEGRGCAHARTLYKSILTQYGRKDDSAYSHLEAYNGMLGGKRYHISVYVSGGTKTFSDESVVDITFWPGW